jgi:ankyrin repeat protein
MSLLSLANLAAAGQLQLFEAVKNRDKEAVRILLLQNADVNARSGDGATALHWAVLREDIETAEQLIRAGADVNTANDYGVTPLALACTNGSTALVKKLLEASANPDATASTGETVLMTCARTGNADAVTVLLDHGSNNINATEGSRGQTALMWAVAYRHPEVVRVLMERGADVHARSSITQLLVPTNSYYQNAGRQGAIEMAMGGFTPLLFSAQQGEVDSARILLAAGANVNDTAPDGNSALVVAAHSGHAKLVAFLLDHGADVNAAGAGYTALHAAVLRGDLEMVTTLLAHRANPNARLTKGTRAPRDKNHWILSQYLAGGTPYLLAAKFAEPEIMRVLASNGADPRLATYEGTTPLMMAAGLTWGDNMEDRRDRAVPDEVVKALHANESRTLAVVKLALEFGSDVNAANHAGDTALHAAAGKGFGTVVQLLVDKGGNMDAKNKRGKTPTLCRENGKVARCMGVLQ